MAKYLIVDDVPEQWEKYMLYLEKHQKDQAGAVLSGLEPHPQNAFISGGYEAIREHLRMIIENDELSLLITDISLGGQDNAKRREMWVTTLLKELTDASPEVRRVLKRRGIGLILVTQHHADILNRIIQDNQHFLTEYFPNSWRYIASEEFEDNIVAAIEDIGKYFEELNGRWFHVDKREEFFHRIGQQVRVFDLLDDQQGLIRLFNRQIISIELSGGHSVITYFPKLQDQQQIASFRTKDLLPDPNIFEDLGATDLTPYGRSELPAGIYPENEYFLQVRGSNPMTFINNSLSWAIRAHPNRGRILELCGKEVHCNFSALNAYFSLKSNRHAGRSSRQ